jgi:hypothetical protein
VIPLRLPDTSLCSGRDKLLAPDIMKQTSHHKGGFSVSVIPLRLPDNPPSSDVGTGFSPQKPHETKKPPADASGFSVSVIPLRLELRTLCLKGI